MTGQGSPHRWLVLSAQRDVAPVRVAARWFCVWACLLCGWGEVARADTNVRLRIEWGGGAARVWQGTIAISAGAISEPRPIGIEADEPGSMWLDDAAVQVRARSARVYDGLDLTVTAPLDAKLFITLQPAATAQGNAADTTITIPLRKLLDEFHEANLDTAGNRLLARRAPGDRLRVRMDRDALVFAPGETWPLEVTPHHVSAAAPATRYRLQARLQAALGARAVWAQEQEFVVGQPEAEIAPLSFDVRLPEQEGAYDLVLTAGRRTLPDRLGLRNTYDERRVQVVVVGTERPAPPGNPAAFEVLTEIDPANPGRFDRLASLPANLPLVPGLRRGPFGSGELSQWQHPLGALSQLAANTRPQDIGWEAFPLPVGRPGQAHILEIEYPSDVPQSLGVSIVEPNAAGAVLPIGLDAGLYLEPESILAGPAQVRRYRLAFWPRTHAPLALLTNRQTGQRAVFGRLRLLGPKVSSFASLTSLPRELPGLPRDLPGLSREPVAETRLPRAVPLGAAPAERLLAAFYDRPLVPENFNADQAADALSQATGRTLDDWTTFYQAGTRLTEYLHYVGYNGAIVNVLADGSAVYPSKLLDATPRYDDGAFFAAGQDPIRKDVLELWLRQFDREQMQFIPALHFSAPLPELEAIRRRGGSHAVGIELVGADGRPWLETHRPRQELAPYYNVLNPRVQEAMLAVVRELAERYAKHTSFTGLAIQLSADGYAQLPGDQWGYDDDTLARFERETRVDLGTGGPEQFARRAALVGGRYRKEWLDWRAQTLAKFYQRLASELTAARPECRLYLTTHELFHRPELEQSLRPALPRTLSPDELLLAVGIKPALYQDRADVVLLRGQRYAPLDRLVSQAVNLEFNQLPEFDTALTHAKWPGTVFFHERQEAPLPSFEAKSPFRKTHLRLVAQQAPAALASRRRFAHALATLDAHMICDGGWLLPLGEEDELREWLSVFRQLPASRFTTVAGTSQPVTLRTLTRGDRTTVYAVNDSPWRVTLNATVIGPASLRITPLGSTKRTFAIQGEGAQRMFSVELGPYELAAATLSSAEVRLSEPIVKLPGQVETELETRVNDLWARAAALKEPQPIEGLKNADFEEVSPRDGEISGWNLSAREGAAAVSETGGARRGERAIKLSARAAGAALLCAPIVQPATGRLSVAVWMRVPDAKRQPIVQIGVQNTGAIPDYVRYAVVGGNDTGQSFGTSWGQFLFPVADLPAPGSGALQIRIEIMGAGEVLIDDAQLFNLDFSDVERLELSKTLTLLQYKRQNREWGECLRLIDGYWPRFLTANVPVVQQPLAAQPKPANFAPTAAAPAVPAEADRRTGLMDRLKNAMPSFWR